MAHDSESRERISSPARETISRIEYQIEFPDAMEDGILIWPSGRNFWTDDPLQLLLFETARDTEPNGLMFEVRDLKNGLNHDLKNDLGHNATLRSSNCSLRCFFQPKIHRWHFDISFAKNSEPAFVRDALDAVEKLQIVQHRLTSFAEGFGLLGSNASDGTNESIANEVAAGGDASGELGAHLFFP